MAPKRARALARRRARQTTSSVQRYKFYVTADLTAGFAEVGPRGGFADGFVSHFLQLMCNCGKLTGNDVCLFVLPPGTRGCTELQGPRHVTDVCYPKCPNDAHAVRKCPSCGSCGSVELMLAEDSHNSDPEKEILAEDSHSEDRAAVMLLLCIGYSPVGYAARAKDWAATTTAGRLVPISSIDGDIFKVLNEHTGEPLVAGVLHFDFVKVA